MTTSTLIEPALNGSGRLRRMHSMHFAETSLFNQLLNSSCTFLKNNCPIARTYLVRCLLRYVLAISLFSDEYSIYILFVKYPLPSEIVCSGGLCLRITLPRFSTGRGQIESERPDLDHRSHRHLRTDYKSAQRDSTTVLRSTLPAGAAGDSTQSRKGPKVQLSERALYTSVR